MSTNHKILMLALAVLLQGFPTFAQETTFTPTNPPEMQRITSHHTPAYRQAQLFLHGVNLADYLEANRYRRHVQVSADEFAQMKKEGFDHVAGAD